MISEDGQHSRSHGISSALLQAQAESIGIPVIQPKTTWKTYEEEFKNPVEFVNDRKILRDKHWFLELKSKPG